MEDSVMMRIMLACDDLDTVIAYLQAMDPNGDYSANGEFGPMTLADARETLASWIRELDREGGKS